MKDLPDFDGPAEPGSPLRNVLDLLRMRGCQVEYVPEHHGERGVYTCYDPKSKTGYPHARLFYPDRFGAERALEFLIELSTGRALRGVEVEYTRTHTITKIVGT